MKVQLTAILFLFVLATDAMAGEAPPTAVVVRAVEELSMGEPITVNAIVRSRNDILLPSSVEGELEWVLAEGSQVAEGGIVAKVDDEELRLRRDEQVLLARRAEINVAYLEKEVERLSALQKSNLASQTQLAEMVSQRDLAMNDVAVARSRIAQLDDSLARTEITSPVAAVVVERIREGGEFARRGDSVVRVVNPDLLEVQLTIPVAYLSRIRTGQPITVVVNDVEFSTRIRSLVRASEPSSQTFNALADISAPVANLVASGQFAEANVPLSHDNKSLFVPRDAVVLRSDGSYVYRIDENNVAKRVLVTLGLGQGDLVSVSGELEAGDNVAVRGVERLTDGQAVNPTNS